jgi:hypothetical protein
MISHLAGTAEAEAVLDSVAEDSELRGNLLVPLSTAATFSIREFERVVDFVKRGELSPEVVDQFSYGQVSHRFGSVEFKNALAGLLDAKPGAGPAVLSLVSMFCHRDLERFAQMRDLFIRLVLMPEVLAVTNGTMIGHHWKDAITIILRSPPDGFVTELSGVLADQANTGSILSYNYSSASPVVRDLLQRFPKEAWPAFSKRIRTEDGRPNYALVDLLCQSGRMDDSGVPLWELDAALFREWATQNLDLMPYILHYMPLYVAERGDAPCRAASTANPSEKSQEMAPIELLDPTGIPKPEDRYVWHPLALVVAELCGEDDLHAALSSNIFSFSSTGSRVPYLEKRRQLIKELVKSEDPSLRQVAMEIAGELESEIEREKKNDAQHAAGIYTW